ncbi:MAG: sensor histidine kinase [Candidatus Thiodiazotropha endolucinida]|nr:sensor histidine kinase [Candidatus Thiodiazotropha taylori]MCW4225263.1 sensor histidine kinase [Candidatus Thiodiazotropha endolucinida]MCG7883269.1 sensor histidine kinase [Candidatus Thiodiazotropha taylori]MCG7886834.1 sensor histidine kinase [Candidatus Thiodiazotropha taylori]MCG7892198.1 sensor histidine kinase [Candidatus Thiodiazotropha taylori]
MSVLSGNSLEHRLHLGLALTLIVLMGLLWLFGARSIETLTEDFIASRLEHDSEALLSAMIIKQQHLKVRPSRINQIYHRPYSGHYYLVHQQDGVELTSRSLWDFKLQVPTLKLGEKRRIHIPGPDKQQLLVYVAGFRKQGQDLTVAVAEDLMPIKQQRDLFLRNFAILAMVGLVTLLLVQGMVVRQAFRRIEPLREEIKSLATGDETSLSEDVPDEIFPLVREINHLLQLLSRRNLRSRNALGNLAHALKGPMNLLTHYFDKSTASENRIDSTLAGQQVERVRLLIDRELKRARIAGSGTTSQRFDPQLDLMDLVTVLKQIYRDKQLSVEAVTARGQSPYGDREDILELLGNLLDNACKWAKSRVRCTISGKEHLRIVVEDDGEGLADEDVTRLTTRGSRLDENREGQGLGLAIVSDVVSLYDGELVFDRSPELRGLRVSVVLNRL